eukprot:4202197-Amphidinium_carterae.1
MSDSRTVQTITLCVCVCESQTSVMLELVIVTCASHSSASHSSASHSSEVTVHYVTLAQGAKSSVVNNQSTRLDSD